MATHKLECLDFNLARIAMSNVIAPARDPAQAIQPSHDGITVATDPSLGRVVIATRDFAPGEIVLSEEPQVLYTSKNRPHSLLASFLRADESIRTKVLDMYHPPLESVTAAVPDASVEALRLSRAPAWEGQLSREHVHSLLMIHHCNAHQFRGADPDAGCTEIVMSLGQTEDPTGHAQHSALFDIGSKVEHGCNPNVAYSSNSGRLQYRCVKKNGLSARIKSGI